MTSRGWRSRARAVRMTLLRLCCVSAPRSERLLPETLRFTMIGRSAWRSKHSKRMPTNTRVGVWLSAITDAKVQQLAERISDKVRARIESLTVVA